MSLCRSLFKVLPPIGPPNAPNLAGHSVSAQRPPPTCNASLFKVLPPRGPPNAPNLTGHSVSAQRSPRRATPRNSKCFCVDRLGSYGFRTGFVVDSLGFGVVVRCGCVGRLVSYGLRTGFVWFSCGCIDRLGSYVFRTGFALDSRGLVVLV